MKPEAIRRIIRKHGFEPVVLILDNGNRHYVANIETIIVHPDEIHLLERNGRFVYLSPGAVSEVHPLPKSRRSAQWPPQPET